MGITQRKIAQAECYDCHEIWPKNEMTPDSAVTGTRSYMSRGGKPGVSVSRSRVWRCPNCQRRLQEKADADWAVFSGTMKSVAKIGAAFALAAGLKTYVFPHAHSGLLLHMAHALFRR